MQTLDNLPSLDMDRIPALFPAESQAARNVEVELPDRLLLRRRPTKRRMLHLLHVSNAAKHLGGLPAIGETWHAIMKGNFNGWDLVPAILGLAEPATIAWLGVATLGFNKSNAQELVELLDAGQVGSVEFIASTYFKGTSADEFGFLHEQLTTRGQKCAAVRSHAKVLLFEMTDGTNYVIESSANLRSCRMAEQFTLTHDAELLAFHRRWMRTLLYHAEPTT
jgi:hypothetical protein